MRFTVIAKEDCDIENAKQLELIINNHSLDDSISRIIKERIDSFELDTDMYYHRVNKEPHELIAFIPDNVFDLITERTIDYHKPKTLTIGTPTGANNVYEALFDNMTIKQDIYSQKSIYPIKMMHEPYTEPMLFKEEIKENHPYGWYRKFEKKRF